MADARYVRGPVVSCCSDTREMADRRHSEWVESLKQQTASKKNYLKQTVADAEDWLIRQGWRNGMKRNKDGSVRRITDLPPAPKDRMACNTFEFIRCARNTILLMERAPSQAECIYEAFCAGHLWGVMLANTSVGKKRGPAAECFEVLADDIERRRAEGKPPPNRNTCCKLVNEARRARSLPPITLNAFDQGLNRAKKWNATLRELT